MSTMTLLDREVELRKLYTVEMPVNGISETGIGEINSLIYPHRLPDNWSWDWLVTGKGEYVGTFTKRLRKWFHKQDVTVGDDLLQRVGEQAKRHTAQESNYVFDITDRFDWADGDYGDGGSCFWGQCRGHREGMQDSGSCVAIRLYDDHGNGYGRCWVKIHQQHDSRFGWYSGPNGPYAVIPPFQQVDDELFIVLFNAYGRQLITFARIVEQFFGAYYLKGNTSTNVYHNSNASYVCGPYHIVKAFDKEGSNPYAVYHFGIEYHDGVECYECGEFVEDYEEVDGQDVCRDCLSDSYEYCDSCEQYVRDHEMFGLIEASQEYICQNCRDSYYDECSHCAEVFPSSSMAGDICKSCLRDHYGICELCKSVTLTDDMVVAYTDDYDVTICSYCSLRNHYVTYCDDCDSYHYDHDCACKERVEP